MEGEIFTYLQDPSHGWIAVTKQQLKELGIADKISQCSYVSPSDDIVWLEEDCDASLFVQTYKEKYGYDPAIQEVVISNRAFLRNFSRYTPEG